MRARGELTIEVQSAMSEVLVSRPETEVLISPPGATGVCRRAALRAARGNPEDNAEGR